MNQRDPNTFHDRRKKTRRIVSGTIFYEYRNRLVKAYFNNLSAAGIFISTGDLFLTGDKINVAIPHVNDAHERFKGEIIWSNQEGCGVKLLEAF